MAEPEEPESHMSDLEALMWNLEKDPRMSSNIATVSMLDRSPHGDSFRARIERASIVFPRLRQRVRPTFGRLAPPRWEFDPYFDLDHHFKRISLGGQGTTADLQQLVTSMFMDPFDRSRPLWEFVVIDGLKSDKAALFQKFHHSITDGEGGLKLSLAYVDFERDAPQPGPVDEPTFETGDGSLAGSIGDAVGHLTRRNLGVAQRTVTEIASTAIHPSRLIEKSDTAISTARSVSRQARMGGSALSPLWTERSLSRAYRTLDVELSKAKTAAKKLGGTVNDFFVTGAAIAAGEYHRQLGMPAESLRMAMPVSTRTDKEMGGNVFSPTQSEIPITEPSAKEQFAVIADVLSQTRSEPMVGAADAMAGYINLLPTSVVARTSYKFASSIDFVTSNLRAAPMDIFVGGALMEASYPMGPLAGSAFNITTMSYRGVLNMGVVMDKAAIGEPDRLHACLVAAYRELLAASKK